MAYRFNPLTGNFDIVSTGYVVGPNGATLQAIARYADTTGSVIEDSPGTLVQDGGAVQVQDIIINRQIATTVTIPTNCTMISDALEMQPGGVIVMSPGSKIIIL
jgi:hypothetical protein